MFSKVASFHITKETFCREGCSSRYLECSNQVTDMSFSLADPKDFRTAANNFMSVGGPACNVYHGVNSPKIAWRRKGEEGKRRKNGVVV